MKHFANSSLALLLVTALGLPGCASYVGEYESAAEATPKGQEDRAWLASKKFEEALELSQQIHEDEAVQDYLQGIMDKLFPEFEGSIRVHVLKKPLLNAFALSNGGIYVNTGLIAALENEAQLASVLAHEGIHFTHKHLAKQRQVRMQASVFATAVALMGVPLVGDLTMATSMSGYSQSYELEADKEGFERLIRAGYAPEEAPKSFEVLLREVKASKQKRPFLFSSHPKLQTRIDVFNKLVAGRPGAEGGYVGAEAYNNIIATLRTETLASRVASGRYDEVIANYEENQNWPLLFNQTDRHFVAEAYRLRNREDDADKAMVILAHLLTEAPDHLATYKSLGEMYYKQGDKQAAYDYFSGYMDRATDEQDTQFVQFYMNKIKTEEAL